MDILITGASGFVGKNLSASLKNIREGKDRTRPGLSIGTIYEYDIHSAPELLEEACARADFVFNLAGVNRPETEEEFMAGNFGFASRLLGLLKEHNNPCPVMLASSIQASLAGRYAGSEYGRSKRAGEELFFSYGEETGAKVLVYRFPNLFGKWCRPNYNSVIATFCHNLANDLPITVHDPAAELELVYIDDLVAELLDALEGKEHRCGENAGTEAKRGDEGGTPSKAAPECPTLAGKSNAGFYGQSPRNSRQYCYVPVSHRTTLGEIVRLLEVFKNQPETLLLPEIPEGSFAKKLYSTYLSYLPPQRARFPLKMNVDARGSFTEILKTASCGQFSVNISKPGIAKGQHWHNSKWELFVVVSGHGLVRQRKVGLDGEGMPFPVWEYEVSGEIMEAVHMLPGYIHSILNLSDTEDLVTLMWANECFDPARPDTFSEPVDPGK